MKSQTIHHKKNSHENRAWERGLLACGVDEVGRGCLAGPLVTAAVILHPNTQSVLVQDSKLLKYKNLVRASEWILDNSWYGYGIVSPYDIDRHNIYNATLIAMKRAIMQVLSIGPTRKVATILVDSMPVRFNSSQNNITTYYAPKGESWSSSIAAASILAKVKRDTLIGKMDSFIPGYRLCQHKGYATDCHCLALQKEGASIIHRNSFLGNVIPNKRNADDNNQTRIC